MRSELRHLVCLVLVSWLGVHAARARPATWPALAQTGAELAGVLAPGWIATLVIYALFAGALFWLFHRRQLFRARWRKVRPGLPRSGQVKQELQLSALAITAVTLYGAPMLFIIEGKHGRIYDRIEERGVGYWLFSLVALVFLVDAYEYWTHRAVHGKRLFKIVHKLHHLSLHPTPWTTFSVNLYEMIISAAFLPLVAFVLPLHKTSIVVYSLFTLIKNVVNHLGYQLSSAGRLGGLLQWVVGPRFHEIHHAHFDYNYGAYFTFWDRWMGTAKLDFDPRPARASAAGAALAARVSDLPAGTRGETRESTARP